LDINFDDSLIKYMISRKRFIKLSECGFKRILVVKVREERKWNGKNNFLEVKCFWCGRVEENII